jgi:vacuolar-type H+-ATPase subunit D/Vma8
MAERIKLNKVSLREQKQKLGLYQRFLPALEARKQQFLMQLGLVRRDIRRQEEALAALLAAIAPWSALFRDLESLMRYFLKIEEVRFSLRNVAGL